LLRGFYLYAEYFVELLPTFVTNQVVLWRTHFTLIGKKAYFYVFVVEKDNMLHKAS